MDKKPACKVVIAFVVGIIVEKYFHISIGYIFSVIIFSILIFFLIPKSYRNVILYFGVMLLGLLRYGAFISIPNKNHIIYSNLYGKKVEIIGWIREKKNYFNEKTKYTVEVTSVRDGNNYIKKQGRILVNQYIEDNNFRYGQYVYVKGKIIKPSNSRNPGEFDYASYLRNTGIFGIINLSSNSEIRFFDGKRDNWFGREIIEKIKYDFIKRISKNFSGQESEILKGLLLGEREGIDPELMNQFAKSGIIHILAVSGLNVGFVVIFLGFLITLLRFPKILKLFLIISGIVFFAILTGSNPPVVRASLISGIFLFGFLAERRIDSLNTLAASALILLLFRPDDLFSASFQLSFAAVLGIIFVTLFFNDFINKFFKNSSYITHIIKKYILIPFIVSLGVVLFISPFCGYYFSRVSLIVIILNLIIIPITGILVGLGFFSLIVGYFLPSVCEPFNITIYYLLKSLILITNYSNELPYSYINISRENVFLMTIFYFLLYFAYKSIVFKNKRRILIYSLIFANIIIWNKVLFHSYGRMKIIFFDVGQGDSALITFPDNKTMLIDGGDKRLSFDAGEFNIAPYLKRNGIKTLDWVVISHPENDHIGGIPFILNNLKVGKVIETGIEKDSEIYKELEGVIKKKVIPVEMKFAGTMFGENDLYRIYILNPTRELISRNYSNTNNYSIVMKVVYGNNDFLFTGDIDGSVERMLARYDGFLQSDVLKVAHHGSKMSTTYDFLNKVKPKYAIISLDEYNVYNFPDTSVVSILNNVNAKVIRTDVNGAVLFTTNGEKLVRMK
jgi:competence protein ComEC